MNKKERVLCDFLWTWILKNLFIGILINLSNDNVISAYAKSEKGYGF